MTTEFEGIKSDAEVFDDKVSEARCKAKGMALNAGLSQPSVEIAEANVIGALVAEKYLRRS